MLPGPQVGIQRDKKIPSILLNPDVHYGVHQSPALLRIRKQTNPERRPLSFYYFTIDFNIILQLYLHLRIDLFPSRFRTNTLYVYVTPPPPPPPRAFHIHSPPQPSSLNHPSHTQRGLQFLKLLITQFFHFAATFSPLGPNIFLNTPFFSTLFSSQKLSFTPPTPNSPPPQKNRQRRL